MSFVYDVGAIVGALNNMAEAGRDIARALNKIADNMKGAKLVVGSNCPRCDNGRLKRFGGVGSVLVCNQDCGFATDA